MSILLVDDEVPLRGEIEDFLTWNGMNVIAAGDGESALAVLTARREVTAVLTDIRMPFLDGLTFAGRVVGARGEADAISVVLMTGHASVESAAAAIRAGAFDFLRKPMQLPEVLDVMRRADADAARRRSAHAARVAELARLRRDYAELQTRMAAGAPPDLTREASPELARILSHELRTPLIPIAGLPDLLASGAAVPPAALNACLRDVREAGQRLSAIADDLIELLAPPHPDGFAWRAVVAEPMLHRVAAQCSPAARAAQVDVVVGGAVNGELTTDESRLRHSLARLVANAIAVTPAGGQVVLSARADTADTVAFAVTDAGPGMTEAQVALACLPFHQLDMSSTRRTGGMGLGLPLASRMAARLGGRLEIASTPPSGTVAAIVLPRHSVRSALP